MQFKIILNLIPGTALTTDKKSQLYANFGSMSRYVWFHLDPDI